MLIPRTFFGWGDGDVDLLFAQDAPMSGQFVPPTLQSKLRIMAQGASLKLADNTLLNRTDVKVGDSVPL